MSRWTKPTLAVAGLAASDVNGDCTTGHRPCYLIGIGWLRGRATVREVNRRLVATGLLGLASVPGIVRAGTAVAQQFGPETIVVFGDSQGQGIAGGLQRVLLEDPRFRVINRTHPGAALVHGENEWLAPVERFAAREKADIAVVMLGANDRLGMRGERGGYLRFRTDEWREVYAARIDRILAALG